MTKWIELFGHIGAFLSSIAFMPQVYKSWKSKHVANLSLTMISIIFLSTVFWIIYGLTLTLWPVVLCNGVILILSLMLIYFKFIYRNNP